MMAYPHLRAARRFSLWSISVFVVVALAACQASRPQEAEVAPEMPAAAESAVEEAAPAAESELQAQTGLKEPAAAAALFSLEDANPFSPADIIQEFGYYHGAGQGICDRMAINLTPLEVAACPQATVEQMGYLSLMLSGLDAGEVVTLTITHPDNSPLAEQLIASRSGSVRYDYIPELTDLPGQYRFTFQTSKGDFEKTVEVTPPVGPHLYLIPEQRRLILHNFSPGENVRLFLYRVAPGSDPDLQGWQEYSTDAQGSLTVEYSLQAAPNFYAIGELSGLVPFTEIGASETKDSWAGGDIACPAAPPPLQLNFDSEAIVTAARVVAEVESYPNVFSFPLPRGTKLRLDYYASAPRCEDGAIWWVVECPRLTGLDCKGFTRVWVPEGRGDAYYIQSSSP